MAVGELRFEHTVVDGRHVLTSPDMPEFYVSHENLAIALSEVSPVLAMIRRLKGQTEVVLVPKVMELEAA